MKEREQIIQRWFDMWLRGEDSGILDIFTENAVYVESWGPEYHGAEKIRRWFAEWNTRGRGLKWDIKQYFHRGGQTVVEWFFHCKMKDGTEQAFDGISLVKWTGGGKTAFLQEFGCNTVRYDPYAAGPSPVFRAEASLWF